MSKFIVLEGIDGSGKTTQMKYIDEFLSAQNIKHICTREPGGIKISEDIRRIVLDKDNTTMDNKTEALLYAASRRQHLVKKIIPAIKEDYHVICDRFVYSSLVYQGYARGIGIEEVFNINNFAIENKIPDLTIFIDVDVKIALRRMQRRKDKDMDRLDLENADFHKRTLEGYEIVMEKYKWNIIKVDGNLEQINVFKQIKNSLIKELNIKEGES